MDRPQYLSKYNFDWELFDVFLEGKSALDSRSFLTPLEDKGRVNAFLENYGFSSSDPILKSELFGYFQEAIQFIKRYFLKDGSEDGLDLEVPSSIYTITDISDLFLMASRKTADYDTETRLWAGIILKVMHTILHADKDLRSNYFNVIQQQIFDRFYKHITRDNDNHLFLGDPETENIPLIDFQTKAKKTRDSVIIKMLHKVGNVAEELFDRVGVRFVTKNKFDAMRVIQYLNQKHVIIAQNIKPSRSSNSLIDLRKLRPLHRMAVRQAIKERLDEAEFVQVLKETVDGSMPDPKDGKGENKHSLDEYRSMQFTCRQLIIYKNPIISQLRELRSMAKKKGDEEELSKKIMQLDMKLISRDVRFFYPFEVQIVDEQCHNNNTIGEASHHEYKKSQLKSARERIFKDLIVLKES